MEKIEKIGIDEIDFHLNIFSNTFMQKKRKKRQRKRYRKAQEVTKFYWSCTEKKKKIIHDFDEFE